MNLITTMDDNDISNIYDPFVFFVLCPILIFIWDVCHYFYRKENSERECSITPLEEIHSDSLDSVSEDSEESGNRIEVGTLRVEEQQGIHVGDNSSQEETRYQQTFQRSEAVLNSSNHQEESTSFDQPRAESWRNTSSPRVESTSYEPTQIELQHGSSREEYFNQSQEESRDDTSTSFNQSYDEVFHPREVLDSSRIGHSNAEVYDTESKENDIEATSIRIMNRGIGSGCRIREDPERSPRRAVNAIHPIFEDKMHKIEDLRKIWQKEMENPTEDARPLINDVLDDCNVFLLSENVISLKYYLNECKEDIDNFSKSVTTGCLYDSWWKVHEMIGKLENKFKSLDNLKRKSEERKNKEISADSSLLRETKSWAGKKRVKYPNSQEDQGRSRIPRSVGQQLSNPGSSTSKSNISRDKKQISAQKPRRC